MTFWKFVLGSFLNDIDIKIRRTIDFAKDGIFSCVSFFQKSDAMLDVESL